MIDSIFIYLFPVRKMKHSDGYLEVCENYFSEGKNTHIPPKWNVIKRYQRSGEIKPGQEEAKHSFETEKVDI